MKDARIEGRNKLYVSIYLWYSNKTTSSNIVKEQQHSSNTTGKYKYRKCTILFLQIYIFVEISRLC